MTDQCYKYEHFLMYEFTVTFKFFVRYSLKRDDVEDGWDSSVRAPEATYGAGYASSKNKVNCGMNLMSNLLEQSPGDVKSRLTHSSSSPEPSKNKVK